MSNLTPRVTLAERFIGPQANGDFLIETDTLSEAGVSESGGSVVLELYARSGSEPTRSLMADGEVRQGTLLFKGQWTNGQNPKTDAPTNVEGELSAAAFQGYLIGADAQETRITVPYDMVGADLDGKYLVLYHSGSTSESFWFDNGNTGTTEPTGSSAATDAQNEVTSIGDADTANTIATKIAAAINGDAEWSATASSNVVTAVKASNESDSPAHDGGMPHGLHLGDIDTYDGQETGLIIETTVAGAATPVIGQNGVFVFSKEAWAKANGYYSGVADPTGANLKNDRGPFRNVTKDVDIDVFLTYTDSTDHTSHSARVQLDRKATLEWSGMRIDGGYNANAIELDTLARAGKTANPATTRGRKVYHQGSASLELDGGDSNIFTVDPAGAQNTLVSESNPATPLVVAGSLVQNEADEAFNGSVVVKTGTSGIWVEVVGVELVDSRRKLRAHVRVPRTGTPLNTTNQPLTRQLVELYQGGSLQVEIEGARDKMSRPDPKVRAAVSGNLIDSDEQTSLTEIVELDVDRIEEAHGYHYLVTTIETSSYVIQDVTQIWIGRF